VRLDPKCVFDIGERTPDRRLLVKEYVKVIARQLAVYAGRPPGWFPSDEEPLVNYWIEGSWKIGFTVTQSASGIRVSICRVKLLSR
jgi:hypothetical protein